MRAWSVRSARRYVSGGAAEDVAHEALLRAWRNRFTCRQPDNPWPWLRQIVHNEALRHLARVAASEEELAPADVGNDDTRLEHVLDRLSLASTIRTLPRAEQSLLRMYYELDMSVASLATLLGVPEGAVKVRLHRARSRLRANLRLLG
jgi:RNA polymerase sigma-70 factor (ECF subfamily)